MRPFIAIVSFAVVTTHIACSDINDPSPSTSAENSAASASTNSTPIAGSSNQPASGAGTGGATSSTMSSSAPSAGSASAAPTAAADFSDDGVTSAGDAPATNDDRTLENTDESPSDGATSAAEGPDTAGREETVVVESDAIFAAPDGRPDGTGTLDAPTTLANAVSRVEAGGTIYLRGGTYALNSTIALNKNGRNDAKINLRAHPHDTSRPKLDFSAMTENSSNRGLVLAGDHWHLYGIDVFKAGDNCLFVSGSHNVIEFSTFSECADTGLQLGNGAADNLILNCDSYYNADSSLENADGFAAKLDVGTGNRFVGCRAWNNLDDGWDGYLRPVDNVTTTHENCWAIDNGKLKDGSVGAGDGNGFKTGGSDNKDLRHNATYERCIAAGNVHDGFDHNSNRGRVTLLNCAAHGNVSNINFGTSNIAASLTVKNTISLGSLGGLNATSTDIASNSWQNGRAATDADFVSVDTNLLKGPRKPDGSLPDVDYLRLVPASDLRNAGTNVGVPFEGSAPDIGPFESAE